MRYDAVIFDNDGVLTEFTPRSATRESIRRTLRGLGVEAPTENDVAALEVVTPAGVKRVADRHDLDPVRLLARREDDMAATQYELLEDGTKAPYDDVDVLRELPVPVGIVSNNQHRTIEHVVDVLGLEDVVDTYYGRDPTLPGIYYRKPDPTYLQRAIDDLDAAEPLYVGDGTMDVEAAHRAGIDVAFIRRDHRSDYDLGAEPTHRIGSLAAIPDLLAAPRERSQSDG